MDIPPIGQSTGMVPSQDPTSSFQDERLTKVVNDALQAAWSPQPGKKLKIDGYVRHIFDEATRSLMQDISLLLRARVPEENKLPNLACEELGRIASQQAVEEGRLLQSFIAELGDNKSQYNLIKLLLVTDLVGLLGLQLSEQQIVKIDEAFEWAVAASQSKEGDKKGGLPDSQVLSDAILIGEESLVDLLAVGYPLSPKS